MASNHITLELRIGQCVLAAQELLVAVEQAMDAIPDWQPEVKAELAEKAEAFRSEVLKHLHAD